MWTTPKKQFSAEELAQLLLIVPQSKICLKQPVRICHNVAFVVNLHTLDDPKDICADENGVWQRNRSPVMSAFMVSLLVLKYFGGQTWATILIITKFHAHTIDIQVHQTSGM